MFEGFERRRIKTSGAEINLVHGGKGPPLLLLHGYPQTHVMWHKVAPSLASGFHVVAADLRGYGDSSKPPGGPDHSGYSKRAMAQDQVEVMEALGYRSFFVAGHDRGARVTHRMALDHPQRVRRAAVLDIVPTHKLFGETGRQFATVYYHWFFLIQPHDFPETLIANSVEYYLERKLGGWGRSGETIAPEAAAEYLRCFRDPATIHASCEDYRAAASIDLEHDGEDLDRAIACPLLVLWGRRGAMHNIFDVLATWRERADDVRGRPLDCGHYLPEEAPTETERELRQFFSE